MTSTTEALRLIETLQKHGIKKQAATEIIGFVERQRGELVTKQDLRTEIEPLKQGQQWLKWIMGGVIAVMIGGFTALLSLMLYLHSDTKGEIKDLKTDIKEIKELLQKR